MPSTAPDAAAQAVTILAGELAELTTLDGRTGAATGPTACAAARAGGRGDRGPARR